MRNEIIHVLNNIKDPVIIGNFVKDLTLDELETIHNLLFYVDVENQNNWDRIL